MTAEILVPLNQLSQPDLDILVRGKDFPSAVPGEKWQMRETWDLHRDRLRVEIAYVKGDVIGVIPNWQNDERKIIEWNFWEMAEIWEPEKASPVQKVRLFG